MADLPAGIDVSRETRERLGAFVELVGKWNPRINLVSQASLQDAWRRHVVDSAQLWPLAARAGGKWLDIGSGGGFPGMVIAVMAAELAPDLEITLVESDSRKGVFLREAARQLGLSVDVRSTRIESLPPFGAQVLSARALSSLDGLLSHASRHLSPEGIALFLKGKSAQTEIIEARRSWKFEVAHFPSATDDSGEILKIWNVTHV